MGDVLLESPEDISTHIYSFYKELFLAEPRGGFSLCADFWPLADQVSDVENAELTLPFSPEEVGRAIASMKACSAPGPDGLPVCVTRLSPVAERIAHPLQSAFLKGQRIHDGILALHEIVHEVASKGLKGVFLKLDFQKAYDHLDLSFLRLVMQRRGFDERWCSWIMQLVRSGNTTININGEVGPFFQASRGVKQGDPVSPLLFNLTVDALAGILDKAKLVGHLKGVEMSGLKINFDKSEVVVLGYSEAEQHRIADNLNCRLASFPISYLGMPLAESRILDRGGLGIPASRRMNVVLMLRWVWRILRGDGGLWLQLIESKYLQGQPLLACSHSAGSHFWKSVQAIKDEIRLGLRFSLDGEPLRMRFPRLFTSCDDPTVLASAAALDEGWNIEFRRSFGPAEVQEWADLREVVSLPLSQDPDTVSWSLSPSGEFSVNSAYQALCRLPVLQWLSPLWKAPMPLKIKIFVWQLLRDRLPSGTEHMHSGALFVRLWDRIGRPMTLQSFCVRATQHWHPLARPRDRDRLQLYLDALLSSAHRLSDLSYESHLKIPIFDGTDYPFWKEKMKIRLRAIDDDMWNVVQYGFTVAVPQPPINEEKKLIQMDAQAKDEIGGHLSRAQFLRYRQCETAKDLWDVLEKINEGVSTQKEARIDTLRANLNRFKRIGNESCQQTFDRLSDISNELEGLGAKDITDHEVVKKLLRSLENSFDTLVLMIYE
ncbi:uncharacterized protein [Aegilops tauschii subsp. strangulata]|uniref:uncharacterized protein n=1 Tax=Aegilops tauschii subsp. strangulata TaxID=200361 RepID=UPI003CC8A09C